MTPAPDQRPPLAASTETPAAAPIAAPRIGLAASLRIQLRVLLIVLTVTVGVPVHYLCHAVLRRSPLPRLVLGTVARILGARVRIEGTCLKRDVFLMANHLTWFDILVLAGASGTAFVAKAEVAQVPVIGWLAGLNHTVFVQREARLGVAAQINDLRAAMADNHAVAIFPEGTTTDGQTLLPFKTAMLKVLEPPPPGIMVQPVLLDYGSLARWIGWYGDEPGLANALRVLARPGSFPVTVRFLEPFSPEGMGGRKAVSAEARARIEAALAEALGRPLAVAGGALPTLAPAPALAEAHDRAEGDD